MEEGKERKGKERKRKERKGMIGRKRKERKEGKTIGKNEMG